MKNQLKKFRKARNLSQSDLARALNISRQAISGFESGKFTPSLEMGLKIAQILDISVEKIFINQETNKMQTLIEKFTQWLPKGEKFTPEAIDAISFAREQAALAAKQQVEPIHLLYGLQQNSHTIASNLLINSGLKLTKSNLLISNLPKVDLFSSDSRYILESALQLARLKQSQQITTEHLLWALIQLLQVGNRELVEIFQQDRIDIESLQKELVKAIAIPKSNQESTNN